MQCDLIVDEVRRVRREIGRKLGSDREAFYQHIRKIQKALGDRVVCRRPRRLATCCTTPAIASQGINSVRIQPVSPGGAKNVASGSWKPGVGFDSSGPNRPQCRSTVFRTAMIRQCTDADILTVFEIINDAAHVYKGVIPGDRWHDPYMPLDELQREIEDGVEFWGYEDGGALVGAMGIQDKGDVCLIRHAYVRSGRQNGGIGTRLLKQLESVTEKPILIGTWASAAWAIAFYQRSGYRLLPEAEKNRLLRTYWQIPDRQVETSVVLADPKWAAESHVTGRWWV